eukprot:TRINITY_DN16837_c0_g1_i4.p1 TRINITY_DN16837_c0_g1~~TRINITY_DN16837_c0_g1_i4.p1  ORF type:complete len:1640 (+),score=369.98 TRINITY_DN16837_c0_g1_i4:136-5055(+)
MGAESSKIQQQAQPPDLGELLWWDTASVRRFLRFVKEDDAGTLRITKWKLLQFTGTNKLQDVSLIYAFFEDAHENSISSLLLAAAMLLLNRTANVEFKVRELMSFFDWNGSGTYRSYDCLFMLQVCRQALGKMMPEMFAEVDEQQVEQVCRDVMGSMDQQTVEAISNRLQANASTLSVLVMLTPGDSPAASALARCSLIPRESAHSRLELDVDGEETKGRLSRVSSRMSSVSRASQLPAQQQELQPLSALPPDSEELQDGDDALAEGDESPVESVAASTGAGERSCRSQLTMVDAEQQQAEERVPLAAREPPLGAAFAGEQAVRSVANQLSRAKDALREQYTSSYLRALAALGGGALAITGGQLPPASPTERLWVRLLGGSLPTLRTAWTQPVDMAPFSLQPSGEALHTVLADWGWLHHACAVQEIRFEAARVDVLLHTPYGSPSAAGPLLNEEVSALAANRLEKWMEEQKDINNAAAVIEALREELFRCEMAVVAGGRALAAATSRCGENAAWLRRDILRLEGGVAYLGEIVENAPASVRPAEAPTLRGRATELLRKLREEQSELHDDEKALAEARTAFLGVLAVREALQAALADTQSPWEALLRRVAELHARSEGSDLAPQTSGSREELYARTALDARDVEEARLRRLEGALIAARALLRGGALRFELCRHEVLQHLRRGVRSLAAASDWVHVKRVAASAATHLDLAPNPEVVGGCDAVEFALASGFRPSSGAAVPNEGSSTARSRPWNRIVVLESISAALDTLVNMNEPTDQVTVHYGKLLECASVNFTILPDALASGTMDDSADLMKRASVIEQAVALPEDETQTQEHPQVQTSKENDAGSNANSDEGVNVEEKADEETGAEQDGSIDCKRVRTTIIALTDEQLMEKRANRFEHRALETAAIVLNHMLADGAPDGVAAHLEELGKNARTTHDQADATGALARRRLTRARAECEPELTDYMEGPGASATLEEASEQIRKLVCDAYRDFFSSRSTTREDQVHGATDSSPLLPLQPQLSLPMLEAKPWIRNGLQDVDAFGCPMGSRRKAAASSVGALRALEFLALASLRREDRADEQSDDDAAAEACAVADDAPSGVAAQEPPAASASRRPSLQGGQRRRSMDCPRLARCAELLAEARILEALAEHHLAIAEREMRTLAEAAMRGRSRQMPSGAERQRASVAVASAAQLSPTRSGALGATNGASATAGGVGPSSPVNSERKDDDGGHYTPDGFGDDIPEDTPEHAPLWLAREIIAACLEMDVSATLHFVEEDPRLRRTRCAKVAKRLVQELPAELEDLAETFAEGTPAGRLAGGGLAANSSVSPGPPPAIPPICEWWDLPPGPLFAGSNATSSYAQHTAEARSMGSTCSRCEELAECVWRGLVAAAASFGASTIGATSPSQVLPPSLVAAYSSAFRVWVLAQHQRLAITAVAEGKWGCLLARQRWGSARRLATLLWQRQLGRQQSGHLALQHQAAARRAYLFLAPLLRNEDHMEHMLATDFADYASLARGDLGEERDELVSMLLKEQSGSFRQPSAGLQKVLAEGVRAGVEAQQIARPSPSGDTGNSQQLSEAATRLLDSMTRPVRSAATGRRLNEAERAVTSYWGTMRAAELLRTLCREARPRRAASTASQEPEDLP